MVAVPDELELDTAAALINDGRTALVLLERGDLQPREWGLVLPGGSGPGLVLVQLARARGGRFAGYGDSGGALTEYSSDEVRKGGVRVLGPDLVHIGGTDKAKRLAEQAVNQAAAGRIRPIVGQTFPLEQAVDAHAAVENRTAAGKTLQYIS